MYGQGKVCGVHSLCVAFLLARVADLDFTGLYSDSAVSKVKDGVS
jgi:hypothetical protein